MKTAKLRKAIILALLTSSLVACNSKTVKTIQVPGGSTNPSPTPQTTTVQGVRTGSGGDGVACYNSKGELENVYLWDYIEAEYRNGLTLDLGEESLSVEKKFQLIIDRILEKMEGKNLKKEWKEGSEAFLKYYAGKKFPGLNTKIISFLNEGVTKNPKVSIKNLKDLKPDINFTDKNCHMVQLAKQEKDFVIGSPFLMIDDYYFSRMNNSHKAGLLAHEFILSQINGSGSKKADETTFPARNLTALASSQDFGDLSTELFGAMLLDMGIIAEVNFQGNFSKDFSSDHHQALTSHISGDQILYKNDHDDKSFNFTAYRDLHVSIPAIINRNQREYVYLQIEASEVSTYENKISSISFNKETELKIPSIHDENPISINVADSTYEKSREGGSQSFGTRCGLYFSESGSQGDSGSMQYDRSMQVDCITEDLEVNYGKQKLVFAKNGSLTFSYAEGQGAYVRSGIVYGGQVFLDSEGKEVSTGKAGSCSEASLWFDQENKAFEIYVYELDTPCPIIQEIKEEEF